MEVAETGTIADVTERGDGDLLGVPTPTPDPAAPRADLFTRWCESASREHESPATLVIAAHPDDEVIGAGGRLAALSNVSVLHVTDGAPRDMRDAHAHGFGSREAYAIARREERSRALAVAGIPACNVYDLDIPDQEAALDLAELTRRVGTLLRTLRPRVVLTHPYEGGHPDHDAVAFAVHAALRTIECGDDAQNPEPLLLEMTSYYAGTDGGMRVGTFLTAAYTRVRTIALPDEARIGKQRMISCYATQRAVLAAFPLDVERFRPAPRYDFARPPHEGTLHYERYPWGMTSARWCDLTRDAARTLGVAHALGAPGSARGNVQ